jgi:hypothetical protein
MAQIRADASSYGEYSETFRQNRQLFILKCVLSHADREASRYFSVLETTLDLLKIKARGSVRMVSSEQLKVPRRFIKRG